MSRDLCSKAGAKTASVVSFDLAADGATIASNPASRARSASIWQLVRSFEVRSSTVTPNDFCTLSFVKSRATTSKETRPRRRLDSRGSTPLGGFLTSSAHAVASEELPYHVARSPSRWYRPSVSGGSATSRMPWRGDTWCQTVSVRLRALDRSSPMTVAQRARRCSSIRRTSPRGMPQRLPEPCWSRPSRSGRSAADPQAEGSAQTATESRLAASGCPTAAARFLTARGSDRRRSAG